MEEHDEDLIDRILAIFTNEAEAEAFNEDPDAYVEEHLPEGTEGADVAACLPEVGDRLGVRFDNTAHVGGSPAAQISHTYNTIYQQNAFIYAEEGAQVTNIQGDGNAVAQQDVDVDVHYGEGDAEVEEPVDEPVDEPVEEPVDEHDPVDPWEGDEPVDEPVEELPEEPWTDEAPEEAPVEEPADDPADDGAEALAL